MFLRKHFSKRTSFFATVFFITNGFIVGLSRIVQYQSFVMLFMLTALYFLSISTTSKKCRVKGIYIGFLCWALSILTHYDGIFITPIVLLLLYKWFSKYGNLYIKHLIMAIALSGLLLSIFYLPFIFNITEDTRSYWLDRITGKEGEISSSSYMFKVYNPIYTLYIYLLLIAFGVLDILIKVKENFAKNYQLLFWLAWTLFPYITMEIIVTEPGTHIYTYLIPAFLIAGLGIDFFWGILSLKSISLISKYKTQFKTCLLATTVIGFIFLFVQSYWIYVDHWGGEYPWEEKKFLIWTLSPPDRVNYHLRLYGFPYNRNWKEINNFLSENNNFTYYSSNERDSISRFYVPLPLDNENAELFIFVHTPQNGYGRKDQIEQDSLKEIVLNTAPFYIIKNEDEAVVEFFDLTLKTKNNLRSLLEKNTSPKQ